MGLKTFLHTTTKIDGFNIGDGETLAQVLERLKVNTAVGLSERTGEI